MNCGYVDCAYQCVQTDQKLDKEVTKRVKVITRALEAYAQPYIDKQIQYKALEILEKMMKANNLI